MRNNSLFLSQQLSILCSRIMDWIECFYVPQRRAFEQVIFLMFCYTSTVLKKRPKIPLDFFFKWFSPGFPLVSSGFPAVLLAFSVVFLDVPRLSTAATILAPKMNSQPLGPWNPRQKPAIHRGELGGFWEVCFFFVTKVFGDDFNCLKLFGKIMCFCFFPT